MLVFAVLTAAVISVVGIYYAGEETVPQVVVKPSDSLYPAWLDALEEAEPATVIAGSATTTGTILLSPTKILLGIALYGLLILAGTFYLAHCFHILEDSYNREWSEKETEARITAIRKRLDIEYSKFALNPDPAVARNFFTKWPRNYQYSHEEFLQIRNNDIYFQGGIVDMPTYWVEFTHHSIWYSVVWIFIILILLYLFLLCWFMFGRTALPVQRKRPKY